LTDLKRDTWGKGPWDRRSKEIPLSKSIFKKGHLVITGTYSSKKKKYIHPFVQRQEPCKVKHIYKLGNNSGRFS
jgi:hypothetical protein